MFIYNFIYVEFWIASRVSIHSTLQVVSVHSNMDNGGK